MLQLCLNCNNTIKVATVLVFAQILIDQENYFFVTMIIHDLIHSCRIYNPLIDVKLRMERASLLTESLSS
ncbi:hypothetical protein T4D_10688 [Trichinella pseudospiralis]|uniref:Uncharacterized protein n=1 Tax=Trichinella pseudospiralis TaxID=6337 RepID=A0A0V1FJC1_TRIPS|nr:hypothetical protein T4D_10688 [Trichinella pseudospiralis]